MKSQVGLEFLFYTALALFTLTVFLYYSYSKHAELMEVKIENELKDVASAAAFEINAAVRAGDGYERRFNMADYYSALKAFNITIREDFVEVSFGQRHYYENLATKNVIGNFTLQWNVVRNENGVIYVN